MKITAGLGSVDDYIRYVKAGADELSAVTFRFPGRRNTARSWR